MTSEPMSPSGIRQNLAMRLHFGRMPGMSVLIAGIASCCLGLIGSATRAPADAKPTDGPSRKFFERYCQTCHAGARPKGEFQVEALSQDFADKENREKWLNVVEQIKTGTMPPKGKPRPAANEAKALTDWIDGRVAATETARNAVQGRAVMRRLNGVEYENAVRDLLGVDVELKDVLPVDTAAGGFDTSAETLHVSSHLLDNYMRAADRVLDAAVASGPRPAQVKQRIDMKAATRRQGVSRNLDDGVAIFASNLSANIQTVLWSFLTRDRGKYRFRISAYAYQSAKPVIFHVNGGTASLGEEPYLIGHFEVPPDKPTIVEFVEQMEAGRNIRILVDTEMRALTLQRTGAADYKGPGVVFQWVDIEGPLGDSWPPPSYRLLFGDMPQAPAADNPNRREVVSQQPLADAEAILRKFTRRAFRRAVTDEDIKPFLDRVRAKLDEKYSFEQALRMGLKAVLVSPNFLFHRESIRPAGNSGSPGDLARPAALDEFSLASRLSYFLWSSMPDEELFQLAEQGKLSRPETLREQVERMLGDPKAKAFTDNFAGQWLGLRDIDATVPDRQLYPEYDDILRSAMIKEVYLFFDEVLKNDLSLTNFVSSDFSMINGRLASHYGIPGVEGLEFRKVALPTGSHRGGVMTMAGILKVTANGTTTSPIVRGAWVLDGILGTPPPKPNFNVEAVDPDIRGATTIRDQLAKHRQVETCAGCHATIDPPGFALENFDVIGGWRENYRSIGDGEPVTVAGRRMRYKNGPPVKAGDVLPDGRRFQNIDEFKQLLLSDKDQLARALAVKLLTYAIGVPPSRADRPKVEAIVEAMRGKNYGFRSLVHEVVQSELFLHK
jgi:mono/diheme cytochrome c family protein